MCCGIRSVTRVMYGKSQAEKFDSGAATRLIKNANGYSRDRQNGVCINKDAVALEATASSLCEWAATPHDGSD